MLDHLVGLLEEQLNIYHELLESALQKKDYIVNNNIESIRRVTACENSLIGKLQRTEHERQALITDIAENLRIPIDGLTLAVLISHINEPSMQKQLSDLRIRLRAEMDKLKEINEQNKTLINHSLEYIDFTMNLLRSSVTGPVYAGTEEIHGQVFFDARG